MKNRWFQLSASVLAMIMIANLQYSWTLFVNPMRAETHWKLADIQWAFTLFVICETWIMPVEGWIIDRIGPRWLTTIAAVLCGIGWGGLGYVKTLPQLYVLYGIAGVGVGFVYSGSIAGALKWFPDKRGLASGIIAGGFGSGSALFIPLIQSIIKKSDYHVAFLYTAIVQSLVVLIVAQVLRHPDAAFVRDHHVAHQPMHRVRRNQAQFSTPEMLRTPHFYYLWIMFILMATGGLMITAQAGPVAKEWKLTLTALTAALAFDRVANGVSRVFWGSISDRMGRENTMAVAFMLNAMCLASVLLLGKRSGTWFTITLIATLFTYGEIFSLFPSLVGDYFGGKNSASNYGFMYSAKGVASIIGGGIAAVMFEKTGTWAGALYGSAAFALIASFMAMGLKKINLPVKVEEEPELSPLPAAPKAGFA